MKTLALTLLLIVLSFFSENSKPSTKMALPPRVQGSKLDVDSLFKVVHNTGEQILAEERRFLAHEESEKKSLQLTVNILKRQVDSLKIAYYRKDYELFQNLKSN